MLIYAQIVSVYLLFNKMSRSYNYGAFEEVSFTKYFSNAFKYAAVLSLTEV